MKVIGRRWTIFAQIRFGPDWSQRQKIRLIFGWLILRNGTRSVEDERHQLARPAVAPYQLLAIALLLAACRPDMANQPKAKPLSESDFFSNQANARPIPPHTVEHGDARENTAFYTGLTNGTYITQLPVKLTPELLARGRERFDAMCAECHDRTGSGSGMVVQRGFPQPPSYHVPRLRNAPSDISSM